MLWSDETKLNSLGTWMLLMLKVDGGASIMSWGCLQPQAKEALFRCMASWKKKIMLTFWGIICRNLNQIGIIVPEEYQNQVPGVACTEPRHQSYWESLAGAQSECPCSETTWFGPAGTICNGRMGQNPSGDLCQPRKELLFTSSTTVDQGVEWVGQCSEGSLVSWSLCPWARHSTHLASCECV